MGKRAHIIDKANSFCWQLSFNITSCRAAVIELVNAERVTN